MKLLSMEVADAYIGILLGVSVFVLTMISILALLYFGGSFERMQREAQGLPVNPEEDKPLLYDSLLEKAKTLPLKPNALVEPLCGQLVNIRNLDVEKDAQSLYQISNGTPMDGIYGDSAYDANEVIWKFMEVGPFTNKEDFSKLVLTNAPDSRPFAVLDAVSSKLIGMVCLVNNKPNNLCIEFDNVWYTPSFQGSGVNDEVVLLMLRYLFDLGYRRVQWTCDAHNIRARKAGHSLGFAFEGVLRKHMIVKDSNRDSAVFSMLNSEWHVVQEQLEKKIAKKAPSKKSK